MMTMAFRTVLDMILANCQTFFDSTDARQQTALNAFLQARVDEGWLWGPWPEWTSCERRGFADPWAESLTYATDDVVFVRGATAEDDAYFVALRTSTGAVPATSAADWAETTTPTDTTIAMAQTGETVIGRVWAVANGDVIRSTSYRTFDWVDTPEGLYVQACSMAAPYVYYSHAPSKFAVTAWVNGAAYVEGDVVFSPQTETTGLFPARGQCYRAATDVDGNQVWVPVEFPRVLSRFVGLAVAGDMQRQYGKIDEAEGLEARAYAALTDDARKAGIRPGRVAFSPAW